MYQDRKNLLRNRGKISCEKRTIIPGFFEIVIVSPILTFFSLSYFTWKELDTDINVGRFEKNRMKITYDNVIIDKRDKNHSFNE